MRGLLNAIAIALLGACVISYAGLFAPAIMPLSGETSAIGGSFLLASACSTGTATVTGATADMAVSAMPVTYPGNGLIWYGYVSSADTITVRVCADVAATPISTAYNVRVFQ